MLSKSPVMTVGIIPYYIHKFAAPSAQIIYIFFYSNNFFIKIFDGNLKFKTISDIFS